MESSWHGTSSNGMPSLGNELGLDGHLEVNAVDLSIGAPEDRILAASSEPNTSSHPYSVHHRRDNDRDEAGGDDDDEDAGEPIERPPYLTPQTHLIHRGFPTPNGSPRATRPSFLRARSSKNSSSSQSMLLSSMDLVSSSSSAEVFANLIPPPLPRRPSRAGIIPNSTNGGSGNGSGHTSATTPGTYSSLPPSPIFDYHDGGTSRMGSPSTSIKRGIGGLGIRELEDVLTRMERVVAPTEMTPEQKDEEFFPARSRRNTLDRDPRMTGGGGRGYSDPEIEVDRSLREETRSPSPGGGGYDDISNSKEGERTEGGSIWEILMEDDESAEDWQGWVVEGKWERISNFLAVPLAVERVTTFGSLLCLDGFLYNFTILPIRATFAFIRLIRRILLRRSIYPIPPTHISSLIRMALIFIPTIILLVGTDASKMYHTVRGQDTIKLYVIFNALEIADRLCGAFGQDVLDTLFAKDTLSPLTTKGGKSRRREKARPYFFFALSLGYVLAHTLIFFYMLVSLNVAINSYDYTLLSLLISNQFVEIKGSVFKKFEKENLFQILCADIVERFQLGLMLTIIAIRNMIEMSGSDLAFLPKSFIKGKNLFDSIASPVLFVIISEMLVDWLKHAFIAKFNHVRATVYGRFTDILAKDVLLAGSLGSSGNPAGRGRSRTHPLLLDQSPLVARRLGFASIPLACLFIRVGFQAVGMMLTSSSYTEEGGFVNSMSMGDWAWVVVKWAGGAGIGVCTWACLVGLKILLGLSLLSYSAVREAGMEEREAEDTVNDFERSPVGESKEESIYNKQTTKYLSKSSDNLPEYASPASMISPSTPYHLKIPGIDTNGGVGDQTPDRSPLMNRRGMNGKAEGSGSTGGAGTGRKGKKWKLEEVERWTMVKRIW